MVQETVKHVTGDAVIQTAIQMEDLGRDFYDALAAAAGISFGRRGSSSRTGSWRARSPRSRRTNRRAGTYRRTSWAGLFG